MLYSELQCSEAIHKAVERMGFAEMTEIQEKTIPLMLAGHDAVSYTHLDVYKRQSPRCARLWRPPVRTPSA